MNDMRKLIQLTENTYSDEAEKHIEGLAKVIAGYLRSVSDDPYVFSDIIEFMGGRLDQRVSKLLKNKITEAMRRPQLSIPPTQKEFEQAYQQLSGMCDSYEVMIEMLQEQVKEAFIAGYFAGHEDNEHGQDNEHAALSDWQKRDR